MTKQAQELKKEYYRKWRAENKEKVAEYQRRHWERKALQQEAKQQEAERVQS